ncbi:hypothetical protein H4Q26_018049 [Puccinia striiformis f. sp. tritici PST-130]|nr:hypothetical protein H4Q26_018049 [Puccinia striiformis f. sp. tritici PST-130]
MFPPLNLTMDLSDPLSELTRSAIETDIYRSVTAGMSHSSKIFGDDRIRGESWEILLVEEAIAPLGSPQSVLMDIDETKTLPEGLDMLADSLADKHEKQLIDLYPPHPILGESIWIVAWSGDVWEPPSNRIALTPPVLNSARQFAFLAVGSEIVEIVPDGLERSIQSDVHGRRS